MHTCCLSVILERSLLSTCLTSAAGKAVFSLSMSSIVFSIARLPFFLRTVMSGRSRSGGSKASPWLANAAVLRTDVD